MIILRIQPVGSSSGLMPNESQIEIADAEAIMSLWTKRTGLPVDVRARVGLALVSFDGKRDTPGALADYRHTRHLPAERWALLRGRPDDVLELAALLGIKYKEDARGQFAHSNVITILNAQGEIVRQQIGLNQDIHETVRLIQQLAAK